MKSTLFFSATLLSVLVAAQGPRGFAGPKGKGAAAPAGPACVVGGEKNRNSPLPPCSRGFTCQKVDASCFDLNPKGTGGCLGTCIEERKPFPKAAPPPPSGPSSGGQPWWAGSGSKPSGGSAPAWGGGSSPPSGGSGWGNPNSPPPQSQPWNSPPPQQQAPPPPPPPPPPQAPPGPQNFGTCPANIRCPNNDICTPDPRKQNTFLCISGKETCGGYRNAGCGGGKMCIADPRDSRSGICV